MFTKLFKNITILAFSTSLLFFNGTTVSATLLKQGMQNDQVFKVQTELKNKGFFPANPTGYFGLVTTKAVKQFQSANGLSSDGIVGNNTYSALFKANTKQAVASRGSVSTSRSIRGGAQDWWEEAQYSFAINSVATVTDIDTNTTFQVKRTYGTNHADIEPLTAEDAKIIKKIWGGWSWTRRAVILTINGQNIAASMTAMPHAGLDASPALAWIKNRSGGYGYGQNLDAVKQNEVDGHMDIHFLNSKTHGSNKVDAQHQTMIRKAERFLQ